MTKIGELEVGTRVRWIGGAEREHTGVIVDWPDRPAALHDHVRVIETVTAEIPHAIREWRHVEVLDDNQSGETG